VLPNPAFQPDRFAREIAAILVFWCGALAAADGQTVRRLRARSASLLINPSLPCGCLGGGARPVSDYRKVIQLE